MGPTVHEQIREVVGRRPAVLGGDERVGQRITPWAVARATEEPPRPVVRQEGLGADRRIVLEFKLTDTRRNEMVEALVDEVYKRVADFLETEYR